MRNNNSSKQHYLYALSLLGIVLFLLSSTKLTTEKLWNPVLWLIGGLLFVFPLLRIIANSIDLKEIKNDWLKYSWILQSILLCVGGYIIFKEMAWLFEVYADKAAGSDVIPSLEAYVQRFIGGEPVYVEIPFSNYSVQPTYFPAMWMPYIIPEVMGFDYRWMAIGCFFILYSGIAIHYNYKNPSYIHAVIIAALPVFLIKWYSHYDPSAFVFATELMPLVFYMLLLLGLTQKRLWLIGVSIALCTMSRYSYTLWIIPFIVIIWREWGFMNLFKIGCIGVAVILVLYVFPFLLSDPSIFTDGLAYYGRTASDQWRTQFWQEDGAIPYHLNNGLSFSLHIFSNISGSAEDKLDVAKILNLIVSLFAALSIVFFWIKSKTKIKWNDYLGISLLLYLVFFYSLLYVPFSYLFMLPLGLGMTIFSIYGSRALKV